MNYRTFHRAWAVIWIAMAAAYGISGLAFLASGSVRVGVAFLCCAAVASGIVIVSLRRAAPTSSNPAG